MLSLRGLLGGAMVLTVASLGLAACDDAEQQAVVPEWPPAQENPPASGAGTLTEGQGTAGAPQGAVGERPADVER